MEKVILDNSAMPANSELLARLQLHSTAKRKFVAPSEAEIEAEIEAARVPWERGKHHTGDVDEPNDDDELVEAVRAPAPADGLRTPVQAARRLGISTRTLSGLVDSGELRYVNVGRGKQREKRMFADTDLDDLITERTRQKAQQPCPSTSQKDRRSTTSTSSGKVVAFTALRSERIAGKRKP